MSNRAASNSSKTCSASDEPAMALPAKGSHESAPLDGDLDQVLRRARRGDGDAFAEIYQRFARTVHGIVLARVGSQDAEDIAQEVFLAIHRGLGSVRDGVALPAWICTVARNQSIDHGRRQDRRPTVLRLVEEPPQDRPQSAGTAEDRELAERVLALIRQLPDAYRETLILRLVEDMTGPEIARQTGMTHGSVRVNLNRGMNLLRPLLRQEGWR